MTDFTYVTIDTLNCKVDLGRYGKFIEFEYYNLPEHTRAELLSKFNSGESYSFKMISGDGVDTFYFKGCIVEYINTFEYNKHLKTKLRVVLESDMTWNKFTTEPISEKKPLMSKRVRDW